jgi:hypothetical protein
MRFCIALALCVAFMLPGLPGCGEADDAVPVEDLSSVAQAATPDWTKPACDEDGITSPATSCDGPWRYSKDPTCVEQHPSCPKEANVCASWSNGVDYTNPAPTVVIRSVSCVDQCTKFGGKWECDTGCDPFPSPQDGPVWCAQVTTAKETELENSVPTWARPWNHKDLVKVSGAASTGVANMKILVSKPTIQNKSYDSLQKCTLTITGAPKPKTAANASACGVHDGVCDHCPRVDGLISAPGVTVQDLGADVVDKECLTCDHLEGPAKLTCLAGRVATTPASVTDAAAFHTAVVARSKLFYELHADLVDATHKAWLGQLYRAEPTAAPVCARSLLDLPCQPLLDEKIRACDALTQTHVPDGSVTAQLGACLGLFDDAAAIVDATCRAQAVARVADLHDTFMPRAFRAMLKPGVAPGEVLAGMPAALAAFDDWYANAAPALNDELETIRRSSLIAAAFWKGAYGAKLTLPVSVDASTAGSTLAAIANADRAVDIAVLNAMFADGTALDSPPLLLLFGDAIATTRDRLRTIAVGHDLACRYQDCTGAMATDPSLQLWSVLGTVHDRAALVAALDAAKALKGSHPHLHAAFKNLERNHVRLELAWLTVAPGVPIQNMLSAQPSPWAQVFFGVVVEASGRAAQAARTGTTTTNGERALRTGLDNEVAVRTLLGQREQGLASALQTYQSNKVLLVNTVLDQMRGTAAKESIDLRIKRISHDMLVLGADLTGLRARAALEEENYSKVADAFIQLVKRGSFGPNATATVETLGSIAVSASSASWGLGDAPNPWQEGIQHVALSSGQQLRWSITGEWSPTCAMQTRFVAAPLKGAWKTQGKDALIGPEGFRLQWSNESFSTSSDSTSASFNFFMNAQLCVEGSTGAEFFGNGAKVKMSACAGFNSNFGSSHNDTDGTSQRTAASFSGGMRLPNTPFPDAPAGALLIVATDAQTAEIVDVQVMYRQGVYVAPKNVHVHVYVNDEANGTCTLNPSALTVETMRVSTVGAIAEPLGYAMADVLNRLRAERPAILAQGALLAGEGTALRSQAWIALELRLGAPLDALPQGIRAYFGAWLDKELAGLERHARIRDVERRIKALELELEQIDAEASAQDAQNRLLALAPRWRAQSLGLEELNTQLRDVLTVVDGYAPPIFELRYPKALELLRTEASQELANLRNLGLDADGEVVATRILALAHQVRTKLENAGLDLSSKGLTMVAIAFPTPAPPSPPEECRELATCIASIWRIAGLLVNPWADVDASGKPNPGRYTLKVRPEDLYSNSVTQASLDCGDQAPVIHRAGLYFVNNDSIDVGNQNLRIPTMVAQRQSFPISAGVVDYHTEAKQTSLSLRVGSGAEGSALVQLPANETMGQGLSPFTEFTIDLTGLDTKMAGLLGKTVSIVLVMELERHRPGPTVAIPGVCE